MRNYLWVLIFVWAGAGVDDAFSQAGTTDGNLKETSRKFKVPEVIVVEHEELHKGLMKATQSGGAPEKQRNQ